LPEPPEPPPEPAPIGQPVGTPTEEPTEPEIVEPPEDEPDEETERARANEDEYIASLFVGSHQAVIVDSVCPLCGFVKAESYSGHGPLLRCANCKKTYDQTVEGMSRIMTHVEKKGSGKGWWGPPRGTHGDGSQGSSGGDAWDYPEDTKMPTQPALMENRPFLFFGSNITGYTNATPEQQAQITEAYNSIDLPDAYGKHPQAWLSVDTRDGRELGLTNGSTTFYNPKILSDKQLLRHTVAHEVGHTILGANREIQTKFDEKFGAGPYSRGTFGITDLYHLASSSEAIPHLFAEWQVGKQVPDNMARFFKQEMIDRSPWGAWPPKPREPFKFVFTLEEENADTQAAD